MVTLDLYDDPLFYDRISHATPGSEPFYVDEAIRSGGAVLELACGTGRLLIPIARAGLEVTGVDIVRPMLDRARAKADEAGVTVDLVQGDMRGVHLGRRFAMILLAYNSMLHLATADDFRALLASVRRHLTPDGVFIFDIFNPSIAMLARRPDERSEVGRVQDPELGEVLVEATIEYDAATQVSRGGWHLSAPGRPNFRMIPLHMRSIFPQELPLLLGAGGFRLEERYGDFDRSRFTSESPRQVCISRLR
jgi:SAM-dependent methyltransferase